MIFLNNLLKLAAMAFAIVALAWLPTSYAANVAIGKCFQYKAGPGQE